MRFRGDVLMGVVKLDRPHPEMSEEDDAERAERPKEKRREKENP